LSQLEQTTNIKQIIDSKLRELKITTLDISFNELSDMYQSGELIIQPEYQRTFRWDLEKRSRFIESLLMEMPIPSIYVIEVEDGKYELIDGLQRISSYLSFRGLLNKTEIEPTTQACEPSEGFPEELDSLEEDDLDETTDYSPFSLIGCDIIPELNGLLYKELQAAMQIKLKRAYVRLEVLRKGINPEMKYHMFKRLNTGGERLTPQEIRNCTIRLIDDRFINFIQRLKSTSSFQAVVTSCIAKKRSEKRFDEELVLKFFAFKNASDLFRHNVDEFLTNYMEMVAKSDVNGNCSFDYQEEESVFVRTFNFLEKACGANAFLTWSTKGNYGVFNTYIFEAVVVGIQDRLARLESNEKLATLFGEKLKELKQKNIEFRHATIGGGKNSPGPMTVRFSKIREMVDEITNEP